MTTTLITLQAAVTHIELALGSDTPPCISLELSLVQDASDVVFSGGSLVADLRLNLRVRGGEPLLGSGEPVPSRGVGVMSYIEP